MATLVTLPPHLIERIRLFLDVELPILEDIRISLEAATSEARLSDSDMRSPTPIASEVQLSGDTDLDRDESRHDHSDQRDHRSEMRDLEDEIAPPTIDIDLVERLSRWATSDLGEAASRAKGLGQSFPLHRRCPLIPISDPSQYLIVSLLAGTQIYVPPKQRALLLSAENPDKVRFPLRLCLYRANLRPAPSPGPPPSSSRAPTSPPTCPRPHPRSPRSTVPSPRSSPRS